MLLPEQKTAAPWSIKVKAGNGDQYERKISLNRSNELQTFIVPFAPGEVSFKIKHGSETILEGKGEKIETEATRIATYNFNAWTGHWSTTVG